MKEYYSRSTNTKRNILFGMLQVIISQFLPFIVRSILIFRFGVEYLGLTSLFTSILSVLSLMELGFGTAVVYSLYKPVAEENVTQICAYLSYFRKIYRIIGVSILVLGLALVPFLDFFIKKQEIPDGLNLKYCYIIFLSDTVISYILFGYMTAIPTAYQRRDILDKVNIGINIFQCIIKSLLLLFCDNFYFYLISIPAITIVRNIITSRVIRRKYSKLICKGSISDSQKHDLNTKVYGLLIGKITSVSRNGIDMLCISVFVGLRTAGIYNNYYYILAGVIAFSITILNSMMASVGNSIVVESKEKNYSDMRFFDFVYMAIAGWATVCLLCLYQPFIKVWLGNNMMLDTPIVIALCLYFYILKSGDIRWVYQESAGLWYESRYIMVGEAVVNIVLNIILCKYFGVLGIVVSTLISVFITNVFFYPKVLFNQYFKNGKIREYWIDHIFYMVTLVFSASICWFFCERFLLFDTNDSYECIKCIIFRLVICTLLSGITFFAIWHRSEKYSLTKDWLKKIIKI